MTARGLMNLKTKDHATMPKTSTKDNNNLSFTGGGKISVSVESIVNSPKVQRQVTVVKEIAASQEATKQKK